MVEKSIVRIVLIGFSGNAREIFEAVEQRYQICAILDDNPEFAGASFQNVPIQPIAALADHLDAGVVCLVGSERSYRRRKDLIGRLMLPRTRFSTIIHPSARISRFASLGCGVVIYPGVTVTSNAVIGDHVMILPHTVVHHDVVIANHAVIGTHVTIAGGCRIGDSVFLGSASSIRNGITIGDEALVGMAANVVRDVPPGVVVVGNPARVHPRRPD